MATIQPTPNSVWPNGFEKDENGNVQFYPLGTNKIDISENIDWPDGDSVISPFVYQDGKLVGFIDTKALIIDNNSTEIEIPYRYFDANLDSIMENTLNITAPADAYVNVKYGAVDKVLTEKFEKYLEEYVEKGNCELKFDKNNNKVTIAISPGITKEQIEEVITKFLPENLQESLTIEIDPLPLGATKVEYLESNGTQFNSFPLTFTLEDTLSCTFWNNSEKDSTKEDNEIIYRRLFGIEGDPKINNTVYLGADPTTYNNSSNFTFQFTNRRRHVQ